MSIMHPECRSLGDLENLIPKRPEGGWLGEREVYEFFQKHMPPDWHVFYDVHFDGGAGHQLDFLVCVPGIGIINVDAKGAGFELQHGHVCCQGRPRPIIAEAAGGRAAIDAFVKRARNLDDREMWGAYAFLIIFARSEVVLPETAINDGFSILNWRRNPSDVANRLRECIEARLNDASYNPRKNERENDFAREVRKRNFMGHWKPLLEIFDRCAKPFAANSKFDVWNGKADEMLTALQSDVYVALRTHRFCHVEGAAGTGKTLIAMLVAKSYAAEGKRVLYVCFNKHLAAYLKAMGEPKGMKITHFHTINQVFGIPINFKKPFIREVADAQIKNALAFLPAKMKFDVLLVDEAQDFLSDELKLLMTLIQESGKAVLFSDENQNIFTGPRDDGWDGEEKEIFDSDAKVEHLGLDRNYRNTETIYNHFAKEGLKTKVYWTSINLGEEPKPVRTIRPDQLNATLSEVLERVPPGQIVVLGYSDGAIRNVHAFRDSHGRRVNIVSKVEDWINGKGVFCTTVHGFKGIDAEVVILLGDSTCNYERLKYIGESRAKYELYIVP